MNNFMTPLEVQLGLGLALLIGLAIGWVARGERYECQREDRKIEKAGVWRCEDRGYYLCLVKEGAAVRPAGLPDQIAVDKSKRAA